MVLAAGSQSTATDPLDAALSRLRDRAELFAREPVQKKLAWLYQMRERVARSAEQWVRATCEQQRIAFDSPTAGEAWILGPGATLHMLHLLSDALHDVQRTGAPRLPGPTRLLDNGQLVVPAYPASFADRTLLPGVTAEVRMNPEVRAAELSQAAFYKESNPRGRVALVLGAGNVGSIPALDVLHKLFVEGKVVVLKINPVNAYVGPILEHAMKPLVDQGYLVITQGDKDVGSYLCYHPLVDEVHITGSSQTHDAIVWGADPGERERRRRLNQPLLTKPITSELGNITPINVVPGPYTNGQIRAMAENIAGMVTQNASFNCVSGKILVLPRGWSQSRNLIAALGQVFQQVQPRYAYYPGAAERYRALTTGGSLEVTTYGTTRPGELPWALVQGLDAKDPATPHFTVEPFCSLLSVVEVGDSDASGFLRQATTFCNDTLWGTLNAMLFVHPSQLKDAELSNEIERSVRELRYGAVGINQWSAIAYAIGCTPWGGHPSSTPQNIQSGSGWVHNTLMLEQVEKCVVSGPLDSPIRPIWSPLHRTCHKLGRALCEFDANPSAWHLSRLAMAALRG